jgi:polyphenol oxidase
MPTLNPDWIVPDWPAPARVKAVFTTRAGGVSPAPYDALNLGSHVGDHAINVAQNRAVLSEALAAKPVFLTQVHGWEVAQITPLTAQGTQADACLSAAPGLACTVMVADCLPVLFTNWQGDVVGAAHAGWRGLAGQGGAGVLEHCFHEFAAQVPARSTQFATDLVARETLVWLGPCIGPQQFEVGDEVRDVFVAHDQAALAMFTLAANGKWLADLPSLARLRLAALGLTQIYGNDGSRAWCTVSNPSRFFSHRRDSVALGGSGRMAACIWLA